jgi:glyoxylase-like metal-dependent hydrolase (beta-lactamase superfamily II)
MASPKPRKQEQESARPEVTEVAPGVLRMQLPITMPGLGHVNCYALLDRDGAAVVDPGLPGASTWRAIQDRLKQAALKPKQIHTVLVTHSHPDHFGCASRFATESKAQVVAHRSFTFGSWRQAPDQPEVSVEDLQAHVDGHAEGTQAAERERAQVPPPDSPAPPSMWGFGSSTPWGGASPRPGFMRRWRYRMASWGGNASFVPEITRPVDHESVLELAGREWFVLHTPGHTGDHICFHDPENGVFLSGDHVLPSITPHISGLTGAPDPLKLFFYSLDRVGEIRDVKIALPAHGHPFADLRGRTDAIKRHHHDRLEKMRGISRDIGRPATVEEFSQQLFSPRSWGPMADSETYAHLEHLRHLGQAERRRERGKLLYQVG